MGGGLTSSGGYMVCTRLRTSSLAISVTSPLGRVAPFSARIELPMLDVRMMVVFLKSTLRPCESVKLPVTGTGSKISTQPVHVTMDHETGGASEK